MLWEIVGFPERALVLHPGRVLSVHILHALPEGEVVVRSDLDVVDDRCGPVRVQGFCEPLHPRVLVQPVPRLYARHEAEGARVDLGLFKPFGANLDVVVGREVAAGDVGHRGRRFDGEDRITPFGEANGSSSGSTAHFKDAIVGGEIGVGANVVEEGGRIRRTVAVVELGRVLETAPLPLVDIAHDSLGVVTSGRKGEMGPVLAQQSMWDPYRNCTLLIQRGSSRSSPISTPLVASFTAVPIASNPNRRRASEPTTVRRSSRI